MAKAAIDLGKPESVRFGVLVLHRANTPLVVQRLHGRTGRGPDTGIDTAHRTTRHNTRLDSGARARTGDLWYSASSAHVPIGRAWRRLSGDIRCGAFGATFRSRASGVRALALIRARPRDLNLPSVPAALGLVHADSARGCLGRERRLDPATEPSGPVEREVHRRRETRRPSATAVAGDRPRRPSRRPSRRRMLAARRCVELRSRHRVSTFPSRRRRLTRQRSDQSIRGECSRAPVNDSSTHPVHHRDQVRTGSPILSCHGLTRGSLLTGR